MSKKIGIIGKHEKNYNLKNINYNSISCDQIYLSANDIINKWKEDRYLLARSVINKNNNTLDNIFNEFPDNEICTITKGVARSGGCIGCILVSRLFINGTISFDKPFEIKTGIYEGKNLILRSFEKFGSLKHYSINTEPILIGSKIIEEQSLMQVCETSFPSFITMLYFIVQMD